MKYPAAQEPVDFFEACEPPTVTHHHKGVRTIKLGGGKFASRMYDKPELVAARDFWASLFMNHRPPAPLTGALRLTIDLTFGWRKDDPKWKRELGWWPSTTKPDNSNSLKTIEDTLKRLLFFKDDNQVAEAVVTKRHGNNPGVRVRIESASLPMPRSGELDL